MHPLEKPLLIYDGDCHFCLRRVHRWQSLTEDRVEYAPFQQVESRFPEIPREAFLASVQLIEPDGKVSQGAEAVFRTFTYAPGRRWMLWVYQKVPLVRPISEWFYRFIARHRGTATSYFLSRWVFLRMLGAIYLIAFVSLWSQMSGLIGSSGILPANSFLEVARREIGPERYWVFPTLCWLNASDVFLQGLCGGGVLLSVLLIVGIAPAAILALLWVLYLSLATVCREFLWFQWDTLLLETGFLAIFFAPLQIRPELPRESPPSPLVLWLLRWLLFRLMFGSGVVKLMSGDPAWRNLTALTYHYETQPLPTWIGWYVHQLPGHFQKISTVGMFLIELAVPFLIFAPRRLRLTGSALLVGFQLLIMATGNYCFFNLLTIALCMLLLDDAVWPRRWREKIPPPQSCALGEGGPTFRFWRWPGWVLTPLAAGILLVTTVQLVGMLHIRVRWPTAVTALRSALEPFRSINRYGLFAVMTTSRLEIIIEGSNDGVTWLAYEFKYKPGAPARRPRFVAPHQPRLDWQMWFAALGTYRENPWLINFCIRLLQGSPEVLSLLAKNPFPDRPPKYLRAVVFDYHFTDAATKRKEGTWWRREFEGLYCPVLSLRSQ